MMTPMVVSRAALVTGCSSGLGRANALALHPAGLPVYASSRRLEEDPVDDDAYAGFRQALAARYTQAYDGRRMRLASSPDDVARVIVRAIRVRRPRTRYAVGPVAKTLVGLRRFAPSAAFDAAIRNSFPVPGSGPSPHSSP